MRCWSTVPLVFGTSVFVFSYLLVGRPTYVYIWAFITDIIEDTSILTLHVSFWGSLRNDGRFLFSSGSVFCWNLYFTRSFVDFLTYFCIRNGLAHVRLSWWWVVLPLTAFQLYLLRQTVPYFPHDSDKFFKNIIRYLRRHVYLFSSVIKWYERQDFCVLFSESMKVYQREIHKS